MVKYLGNHVLGIHNFEVGEILRYLMPFHFLCSFILYKTCPDKSIPTPLFWTLLCPPQSFPSSPHSYIIPPHFPLNLTFAYSFPAPFLLFFFNRWKSIFTFLFFSNFIYFVERPLISLSFFFRSINNFNCIVCWNNSFNRKFFCIHRLTCW